MTGLTFRSIEVKWTSTNDKTTAPTVSIPCSRRTCSSRTARSAAPPTPGSTSASRSRSSFATTGLRERRRHRDRELVLRGRLQQHAHDNTAGHPRLRPARPAAGGRARRPRLQQHDPVQQHGELRRERRHRRASYPAGTGFFVMANHNVEVFGNTITGNKTAGAGDHQLRARADAVHRRRTTTSGRRTSTLHDNTYSGNGTMPDVASQIGIVLLDTGMGAYPDGHVPDVMWDGIVGSEPAGRTQPDAALHQRAPGVGRVQHALRPDSTRSNPTRASSLVCDATPFECTLPALPPVSLPGLTP